MSQPRVTELLWPGDHLLGCSDEDAVADHLGWHRGDRVLERGPVVPFRNDIDKPAALRTEGMFRPHLAPAVGGNQQAK